MYYLLTYEGVANYADVRAPFRPAHLQHAKDAFARGELVQAGALLNPTDGSVLVFRGDSPAVAEHFAATDPFVLNGVVKRWTVREWNTIVGADSTAPTIGT